MIFTDIIPIKKSTLLLSLLVLSSFWLAAQNVGVNTITPQATFHVELGNSTTNGVLFSGTQNNETNFPSFGPGNRFMFYPARAALRAGTVGGTHWDNAKVGVASVAFGSNTIARSAATFATNYETTAGGFASSTFGSYTISKGYSSMAIGMFNDSLIIGSDENAPSLNTPLFMIGNGNDLASRHNAMVIYKNGNMVLKNPVTILSNPGILPIPVSGSGTRMMWLPEKSAFRVGTATNTGWNAENIGTWSFATGKNTKASGLVSTSLGNNTIASGDYSTAVGGSTIASGYHSTAFGYYTRAHGAYATAMGFETIAKGFGSTVIGLYNDSILIVNEGTLDPLTPLFIIGNGTAALRSNAMVVRKDGNVGIGTNSPFSLVDIHAESVGLSEGFMVRGDYYSGASSINMGAGNRMTFYPGKGVFRAGGVSGTQWDDDNAGEYSVAMGFNSKASGDYSIALGPNAIATGMSSYALGSSCVASGSEAIAFGALTQAKGARASAFGLQSISKSYAEIAIGQYNDTLLVTTPNSAAWESNDALLVGGNGTGVGARSNAFVFYKNGNAEINGYTQLGKTSEAAPSIKMKKLTGTSNVAQNAWTNVPHGLTKSKILSVDIIMNIPGFVNVPPGYTYNAGYEYQFQIADSNIVVINTNGNSANILNKTFTILITYEE